MLKAMKPLEPMSDGTMAPVGKINPLKTQMTLQQLQKMAEKQRQQILRNNQELIAKQQRLIEMQSGSKKAGQGSPKPSQNDAYASKLRETYQNHLGRLREMKLIQDEVDSQRFNNVELAHELDRVREIFTAKQRELVSAAAKVDNLTKQLEDRRNGLSSSRVTPEKLNRRRKIRAAREELDKLRKELTVRNEVNNQQEVQLQLQQETLKEKRKELSELDKKISLLGNQLKPNQLSDYDSDSSNSSEMINGDVNGNSRFGPGLLFDTLTRKKMTDRILQGNRSQPLSLVNGYKQLDTPGKVSTNQVPYIRRGKFYVAPDGREFDRPPTVEDYPEFAQSTQIDRSVLSLAARSQSKPSSNDSLSLTRAGSGSSPHLPRSRTDVLPSLQINTGGGPLFGSQNTLNNSLAPLSPSYLQNKMPSHSPSSSVSSLSSLASCDIETNKTEKVTTSVDGLNDARRVSDAEIWNESTDFRTSSPIQSRRVTAVAYKDADLSTCRDAFSGVASRYQDCHKSDATELLNFQKSVSSQQMMVVTDANRPNVAEDTSDNDEPPPLPLKQRKPEIPKKPQIAPKPALPPKNKPTSKDGLAVQSDQTVEKDEVDFVKPTFSHSRQPNVTEFTDDLNKISVHDLVEQFKDAMPAIKQPIIKQIAKDHYPDAEQMDKKEREDANVDELENEEKPSNDDVFSSMNFNDQYEMTFADIDAISASQNDLLPYLNSIINVQPFDQSEEEETNSQASDVEKPLVPVVISVPPEKMPPTILKKPGRENKKRGRIQLDPHALLLDAALEGEMSLVKEIVAKVPDPSFANAEGITALHNAVCGNHKEVVRFLVEIGCDINSPDNNGWTPLHCAAFYNDVDLCRFLVEHGASVYAMTYSDRQTAAEKCSRLEENYDQCFSFLHDLKESVGRKNNGEICSLYDYNAEREDELSFHCGEQLRILRRGDANEKEWWWAENKRKETGYVPYNLLGIYPRIAGEV